MSSRKGGLGRNLDSLIPTPIRAIGVSEPVAGKLEVPIDSIRPNPKQPRTVFDDGALLELAASIREIGILQPPVVRQISEGSYELIMGERRLRAARLAGLDKVPVIIRQTSDDELLREALVENIHRSNLNALEEAAAYNQMLTDFGFTHDELATRLGRSRPLITNTIRLLNLPPSIQSKLSSGQLSPGHARALLSLTSPQEAERIAAKVIAEGLSVRATEELIANSGLSRSDSKGRSKSAPSGKYQELEERIGDSLSTRVKIKGGSKGGRIIVEFADSEDLLRIATEISER